LYAKYKTLRIILDTLPGSESKKVIARRMYIIAKYLRRINFADIDISYLKNFIKEKIERQAEIEKNELENPNSTLRSFVASLFTDALDNLDLAIEVEAELASLVLSYGMLEKTAIDLYKSKANQIYQLFLIDKDVVELLHSDDPINNLVPK
jgi:hypothetical protein